MKSEDIRNRNLELFKLICNHCDRIEADANDEDLNPNTDPAMMDTCCVRKYVGEMVELFGKYAESVKEEHEQFRKDTQQTISDIIDECDEPKRSFDNVRMYARMFELRHFT